MGKCSNQLWNCLTSLLPGINHYIRQEGVVCSQERSWEMCFSPREAVRRPCESWALVQLRAEAFMAVLCEKWWALQSAVLSHQRQFNLMMIQLSQGSVFGNGTMPETVLLLNKINLIKHRHCLNRSNFRSIYSRLLFLTLMRPFKDSGGK